MPCSEGAPARSRRHHPRRQQPRARQLARGVRRVTRIASRRSTPTSSSTRFATTSKWFWDDPDRHREGRLQLDAARREVVRLALLELGVEDAELADCIGDAYSHRRDVGMAAAARRDRDGAMAARVGPPARAADQRRRARPSAGRLRASSSRDLFDAILVEGELGFGKPDERVYRPRAERARRAAVRRMDGRRQPRVGRRGAAEARDVAASGSTLPRRRPAARAR